MKAASLFCLLVFCASAAQSQTVFLEYDDPFGDGTAFLGPAQIELRLWIEVPPGAEVFEFGNLDVLYDPALTSLNQINMVLPPCSPPGSTPCAQPGTDNTAGTIADFFIDSSPVFLQGMHHIATLIFNALDEGDAVFDVTPGAAFPAGFNFSGTDVLIVLPTCESDSLPENFHDSEPATGLPTNWENIFVDTDPDSDGDGVADASDNCLLAFNPSQCDTNGDNIGNHCDADTSNDCFVNFIDLGDMRRNFFLPGDLDTDLNCDGVTNFLDLLVTRQQFFQSPGPSGLPNACNIQRGDTLSGWQTTAGGNCDFNGDFVGDNVTGGLEDAACLEGFVGAPGPDAALCTSAPLALLGATAPVLELHANFQPTGAGGLFQVIAGSDPPTAATLPGYSVLYETDAALGTFESLPGEALVVDLQSAAVTPLYVCVLVTGDFHYAEVDHCIACALSCGAGVPANPSRNPGCGIERQ